jgi:hypothetical protein
LPQTPVIKPFRVHTKNSAAIRVQRLKPIAAGTIDRIVVGEKYYIQTRKAPNLITTKNGNVTREIALLIGRDNGRMIRRLSPGTKREDFEVNKTVQHELNGDGSQD